MDKTCAKRILDFLDQRIAGPESPRHYGKALTGQLGNLWRYRVGDYRVLCEIIDGQLSVLALDIDHRKSVYH